MVFDVERWNDSFMNYYFGIHETEVTTNLPAYTARMEYKASAAIVFAHKISESWRFLAWAEENYYGDKIYASPTVGKQYQFQAGLGWLYKFF